MIIINSYIVFSDSRVSLKSLDYSFGGQPFADVDPASSGKQLYTLDYAFGGQPFVTNGKV